MDNKKNLFFFRHKLFASIFCNRVNFNIQKPCARRNFLLPVHMKEKETTNDENQQKFQSHKWL